MTLQKKDFIEMEFTGKIRDTGEIFDSNIKEDLERANIKAEPKPLVFALGEGMFLEGIDNFLIGKPSEKADYQLELKPEDAFGKRKSEFVKMVPMRVFREQNVQPVPGAMFNFDGNVAKILSVSGGRVLVDFNNPIAGKNVEYKIKVLKKIEDLNEKAKALINFFFKRDLEFEIKDKKIELKVEESLQKFAELFKDKFKEILDLDLEVKEIKSEKKEEAVKSQ